MRRFKRIRDVVFNPSAFSVQILITMIVGGLLAAVLMRPDLDAGPVRVSTYVVFSLSSAALARRYIGMVRRSQDGQATLLVVASCWWWLMFSLTAAVILYLILARAYGLWPNWGENLTERISYFFISGSAIGVAFKAWTFQSIPDEQLQGRRVSAWPFTIFRNGAGKARPQDSHIEEQDARDVRQDERGLAQDQRGERQDERDRRAYEKD